MNKSELKNESVLHIKDVRLAWKVNTGGLLKEILNNEGTSVLLRPLQIFAELLSQVAKRSNELRDPVLDKLMCELALYEQSDPYSKDYDKEMVEQVYKNYEEYLQTIEETKKECTECEYFKIPCMNEPCNICLNKSEFKSNQ